MEKEKILKPGAVDYQMPKEMAEELIKLSGKNKKHLNIQEYLIGYVNRECGLKNNCTKVTLI
jgi:hypothetical protein